MARFGGGLMAKDILDGSVTIISNICCFFAGAATVLALGMIGMNRRDRR